MSSESASTVNITLNGSDRVVAGGVPDAYRMPSFRDQLNDKEIAEVANFVRKAWGNSGGSKEGDATAKDVAKLRKDTRSAGYVPKILPSR